MALSEQTSYYLEYDTPRAGGFEPLAHLPKNKNVVLGVITSKFPELENLQEMVDRVYSAADIMAKGSSQTREEALARISVSPQCGTSCFQSSSAEAYVTACQALQVMRKATRSLTRT